MYFLAALTATASVPTAYANVPGNATSPKPLSFLATPQPVQALTPWWQSIFSFPMTFFQAPPEPADDMIWSPTALLPTPPPLCAIQPVPAIDDLEALSFEEGQTPEAAVNLEGLTPATRGALKKFEATLSNIGGELTLTSAYRPLAYQEHLMAVWDKWQETRNNQEPACQPLKASVEAEFTRHTLMETQRPVTLSDHTMGIGFDAYIVLPASAKERKWPVSIDRLAALCSLRRPDPLNDHVHFRLAR